MRRKLSKIRSRVQGEPSGQQACTERIAPLNPLALSYVTVVSARHSPRVSAHLFLGFVVRKGRKDIHFIQPLARLQNSLMYHR